MYNFINNKILHGLKNLEIAGYAQEVVEATELLNAVSEVEPHVGSLKKAAADYDECLYMKTTRDITAEIHNITLGVESAWLSITKLSDGLRYSSDQATAENAVQVFDMMQHYGNIARKSYDNKYGAVASLLANITDEQAKALGIEDFVEAVRNGNEQFVAVSAKRKDYRKLRKAKVAMGRKALESALSLLFGAVNNLSVVLGEEKFLPFINRIDEIHIERVVKAKSSTKAAQEQPEPEADKPEAQAETPVLEHEPKDSAEPAA